MRQIDVNKTNVVSNTTEWNALMEMVVKRNAKEVYGKAGGKVL